MCDPSSGSSSSSRCATGVQKCTKGRGCGTRGIRRGLGSNIEGLWFRTVLCIVAAVVLARQATCLRFSIDPVDGSVQILRGRTKASLGVSSEPLREFRECGGNLTALSQPARLYSPGYPKEYESNMNCRWIITADRNITLHFVNVEVEGSPGCEYDHVDLLIGSTEESVDKLCGTVNNHTVYTNSTAVTVVLRSDESYEERGFFMEFFADSGLDELADSECSDTLTGEEGNLTSPGYPLEYPNNRSCWYLINVEPDRIITMRFEAIALEFDGACAFDYVEIFDGPSEDSQSFGRFCSDSQKRVLRSTSNSVLVHFKSDDLQSGRGFLLQYESHREVLQVTHEGGCTVASDSHNGTVTTPNYPDTYPALAYCLIDIEAPREAKVLLQFSDFSLEQDTNCSSDFVEIWDGRRDGWQSLGRVCGDGGEKKDIVSTESRMRLKFSSNNVSELRGFIANFYLVAPMELEANSSRELTWREPSLVPADQLILEISAEETVAVDGESILKCLPKVPGSSVEWIKNDSVLNGTMPLPQLYLVSVGKLWIRRMHSGLAGTYTCVVTTKVRKAIATLHVVMTGPKPSNNCSMYFLRGPVDQEIQHNQTAIMQCTAHALQRPSSDVTVSWLRDGLPFPISFRYVDIGNGLVYVRDVIPSDSAVYTCVATDRRNNCTVRQSALLRVLPKVDIEKICGVPRRAHSNDTEPHIQHGKIVGGRNSIVGAYPWQVMFWTDMRKSFCGGSLLNDQWVLTASHCLKRDDLDIDDIEVKLGKYDIEEVEPQQVVTKIADVYYHPNFDAVTFDNDIALVLLANRVSFTDYIQPVCLGDSASIERDFFTTQDVRLGTVTGWGQLTESGNALPRFMQEVRLPIIDHDTCKRSTTYKVTDNMFCAGYKQDIVGDACQGDSGGPFVVQQNESWYLIGIVSWGVGCGRRDHYGYYTKVTNYHSWIKEKIF